METSVLAPLCSFFSSTADGLTSFGSAILLHVCTQGIRKLAGSPLQQSEGEELMRFSVACTLIISIISTSMSLYFGFAQLRQCTPYGFTQGLTGLAMVPVGTWLLFMGDMSAVRVCTGIFFASFSCYLLIKSFLEEGRERKAGKDVESRDIEVPPQFERAISSTGIVSQSPALGESPTSDDTSIAASTMDSRDSELALKKKYIPWPELKEEEGGEDGTALVSVPSSSFSPGSVLFSLESLINKNLSPLSKSATPFRACMTFLVSGVGAGFFNGLLGVGGPPQMIAFALLQVHKDLVRGVAVSYNVLEMPVRLLSFFLVSGRGGMRDKEVTILAFVAAASVSGFSLGTYLRRFADTRLILRLMLLLTTLGAAIMVDALDSPLVGGLFLLYVAALLFTLGLIRFKGLWVGGTE